MTLKKKLRVAAVGLGWVCRNRHLPTMQNNCAYQLVGAVDRNGLLAREVAKQYGMPNHHKGDSLEEVSWLDQIDAVTIGTAPSEHYEIARQALKLGKHVLTEKPFTLNEKDGAELAESARTGKLTLGIVHNFQFSNSFQRLERDLDTGKLGQLQSIVARQFGNPRRRLPTWYDTLPMGLFYDESPHLLYLIRRLSGGITPTLVRADAVESSIGLSTPALIEALYTIRDQQRTCPISLLMTFEAPISEWHLSVLGEEGIGIVDLFRDIYIRLPNDGTHGTRSVIKTSLSATWQHWIQHLTSGSRHLRGRLRYGNDEVFARFAKAALNGEPLRDIGADDAQAVLGMQHDLLKAIRWVS